MILNTYSSYKDFGIEGLDKLPEHWLFDRIKNIGSVNGRVGWKALKASEYVKSGYFFLSTPNIKYREIDYKNVNYITKERYLESPEIMLHNGDVLLVKDGSTLGIVNIVKDLPSEGTVNSSIAVLRFKRQINEYIYYLLISEYVQNKIALKKDGMGVPHLFQRDINDFLMLLPPLVEQRKIANYLDKNTLLIERKIEILESKTIKYQELKTSLINKAIYNGLGKNTNLIDSKIDWLGKIPSDWSISRLGVIFKERSEKVSDKDYPPLSVTMQGIVPQLSTAAKTKNGDNRKKVLINDFVINSRSDRKGSSGVSKYIGSVSVISIVLIPSKAVNTEYFHYAFKSYTFTEEFYKRGKGIVDDLWSTKYSVMRNMEIQIPPIEQQLAIAEFLREKTTQIEKIIEKIKNEIVVLKELKETLINDVVTGKIKVIP